MGRDHRRPRYIVDETARLHRDGRDWPENSDAAVVVASEKVGRLTVALELTVPNEGIRVPVGACTLRDCEYEYRNITNPKLSGSTGEPLLLLSNKMPDSVTDAKENVKPQAGIPALKT